MSSKAARKRNKRKFRMPKSVHAQPKEEITLRTAPTTRPTAERLRQGTWAEPSGMGKDMQPIVDLASDMIGQLFQTRQINAAQEQAARTFQEARAAWLAEFELAGFKSCLAGGQAGYDASEGNPEAKANYQAIEKRIGMVKTAILEIECEKLAGAKPNSLIALRRALDAMAGY